MCIIFFSLSQHPEYRLIVAANRDEFKERPTEPLHEWESGIVAGRDLVRGGTWLGLTPGSGRIGFVTNVRHVMNSTPEMPAWSRGELLSHFLLDNPHTPSGGEYLAHSAEPCAHCYDGFNIVVGDLLDPAPTLYYFSNGDTAPSTSLSPGTYGVSNATLDTPWSKLVFGKTTFESIVSAHSGVEQEEKLISDLIGLMRIEAPQSGEHDDPQRPEQRVLFIDTEIGGRPYGTRANTVVLVRKDGSATVVENSLEYETGEWRLRRVDCKLGNGKEAGKEE